MSQARTEFLHALSPNRRGLKAAAYATLTLLPAAFLARMRKLKGA